MAEPRQQPSPRSQPAPVARPDPVVQPIPRGRGEAAPSPSSAAVEAIKAKQRAMSEAGFATAIDGRWGPDSEKMWSEFQQAQRDKAARENEMAQAKAQQAKEEATAKAAEASARAAEAKAEADKISALAAADKAKVDRETASEKAKREAIEAAIKLGLNIAFPVAGAVIGHGIAHTISSKHDAALAARAAEMDKAAKQIATQVRRVDKSVGGGRTRELAKLRGMLTAADKLALTRVKGPLGLATAVLLLSEGAFARFVVSEKTDSPIAKEALQLVSTASIFAATSLVGERAIANQTVKALPNAASVAQIEAARELARPRAPKARGGVVGSVIDAAIGPPKPALRVRAAPTVPPPIPAAVAIPVPSSANVRVLSPGAKRLGIFGVLAGVGAIVLTARSQGAAAAVNETAKLLDPTAGAATRVIEAITAKPEPKPEVRAPAQAEPSLRELAKSQAAERTASTSPIEHLGRDAAAAQLAPAQAELADRVLSAGGGGLENFYQGPQPAEHQERAQYQGLAAEFAREANTKQPPPQPQFGATVGPAPPVDRSNGGPRGWANPKVQEAAQKARREKGLI